MRPRDKKKLIIVKRLQRSLKGFTEVATRSPSGPKTKLVLNCLLSMHMTDLVAQRFYLSPRGLKVVLFSLQIGFQSVSFRKGWGLFAPIDDLYVTDQWWGGDQSDIVKVPIKPFNLIPNMAIFGGWPFRGWHQGQGQDDLLREHGWDWRWARPI